MWKSQTIASFGEWNTTSTTSKWPIPKMLRCWVGYNTYIFFGLSTFFVERFQVLYLCGEDCISRYEYGIMPLEEIETHVLLVCSHKPPFLIGKIVAASQGWWQEELILWMTRWVAQQGRWPSCRIDTQSQSLVNAYTNLHIYIYIYICVIRFYVLAYV